EGAVLRGAWLDQDAPPTLGDFVRRQRGVERRIVVGEQVRHAAAVVAIRSAAIKAHDGLHVGEGRDTRAPTGRGRAAGLTRAPTLTWVRLEASRARADAAEHNEEGKRSRSNVETTHLHGEQATGAMLSAPCTRRDWRSSPAWSRRPRTSSCRRTCRTSPRDSCRPWPGIRPPLPSRRSRSSGYRNTC